MNPIVLSNKFYAGLGKLFRLLGMRIVRRRLIFLAIVAVASYIALRESVTVSWPYWPALAYGGGVGVVGLAMIFIYCLIIVLDYLGAVVKKYTSFAFLLYQLCILVMYAVLSGGALHTLGISVLGFSILSTLVIIRHEHRSRSIKIRAH